MSNLLHGNINDNVDEIVYFFYKIKQSITHRRYIYINLYNVMNIFSLPLGLLGYLALVQYLT